MTNVSPTCTPTPEAFREYLLMLARIQVRRVSLAKLEASDLVQQTLLEAHRKREQFRGTSDAEMAGWLRKLLASNMADEVRFLNRDKRDVGRERSLQAALDHSSNCLGGALADGGSSPSHRANLHEQAIRVACLLALLPDAQRQALVLRHCEGNSIDEISVALGRTPAAVAGLLKRGAAKLRTLLIEPE